MLDYLTFLFNLQLTLPQNTYTYSTYTFSKHTCRLIMKYIVQSRILLRHKEGFISKFFGCKTLKTNGLKQADSLLIQLGWVVPICSLLCCYCFEVKSSKGSFGLGVQDDLVICLEVAACCWLEAQLSGQSENLCVNCSHVSGLS